MSDSESGRHRRSGLFLRVACLGAYALSAAAAIQAQDTLPTPSELKKMSLEELMDVKVTLVSRRAEHLTQVPSSIQAITGDDIKRSGVTTLPEALRLAPNLQVAQIDSRQWAISARGHNGSTSNKLLVMIDGRTVYTPLYSGVFWDVQNLSLENIERIEVISGPGGTLWGANAVNGVINVVTKGADETQGGYVSAGGGTFQRDVVNARYGGKLPGQNVWYRAWGQRLDLNGTVDAEGDETKSGWGMNQGGARVDWVPRETDRLTVIGSLYAGEFQQALPGSITADGQYLLGRWTRTFSERADVQVQAYLDRAVRDIPGLFGEDLQTYDFDFQHRFPLGARNSLVWGAGYRLMQDRVENSPSLAFLPADKDLQLSNFFAQDQFTVWPELVNLTFGSKVEHNDYSGFDIMPSLRVAVTPNERNTVWGSVSHAVRSPSRIDVEFYLPPPGQPAPRGRLAGGPDFMSEDLMAYEAGWRSRPLETVTASLSAFYDWYQDLRVIDMAAPGQYVIANGAKGETKGVEAALGCQVATWWQARVGYTWMQEEFWLQPGHSLALAAGSQGNDPEHRFSLQSMMNLPLGFQLNANLRYVSELPTPIVPYYVSLDLTVAWMWRNLDVSVSGHDLSEERHAEFGAPATRQQVPRSMAGRIGARF